MRGPWLLLAHSLKRIRILVLTMGVLLAAFQVLLVAVARSILRSAGFEQLTTLLPPFIREAMGPSFAAFMSFGGIVSLGYFHVAIMGSLVGLCIALATVPTSEVETGFMDLILARPLARHWIVTRTIVLIVLVMSFLLGLMVLGTWTGLATLAADSDAWPSGRLVRSLALNLGLLILCWAGIALAAGSAARRRSVAGSVTGVLALAAFLLDYLGRVWPPVEKIAWMSPFRYYSPLDMVLGGGLPLRNAVVLCGIAVAGFVLAYALFSRRDISR